LSKTEFVHLHVHSEYSLLDGAIRLDDLVEAAAGQAVKAVAVTEHGNLYSAVEFYQKATAEGVKPILGIETYVAPGSRRDRGATKGSERHYHLTLLAENNQGYKNLIKLSSIAFLEGFYYKPRIDWEVLEAHHEGVIALSGCLQGQIPALLLRGEKAKAREIAARYRDLLGKENFFIELMDHGLEDQRRVLPMLVELARDLDLPLVATNDSHYLRRRDHEFHEILVCLQTNKKLSDEKRMRFGADSFYLRSPEEMAALFADYPQAIRNTVAIAERCNVSMTFGQSILPEFEVPEGFTVESYLRRLAEQGLEERLRENGIEDPEERKRYHQQLEYELKVIIDMGFAAYFLIVHDFVNFARRAGIRVGPGRGSAASSLVSYSLRITNLDPIRYRMVFERFLNPHRVSMPDIDIDLCSRGRAEVIHYVVEKYGADRVAQVITFGRLKARMAIRDVGRVLDFSYAEVDRIAKLAPPRPNITLKEALEEEPELRRLRDSDPRIARLLEASLALEGLARHPGVHAAAIVISRDPLIEHVPLTRDSKEGGLYLTQFSMDPISDLGLLKMDFLGLRNQTLLADAVKLIEKTKGVKLDIDAIPLDDAETYKLLSRGETVGVFQFESQGMREWLQKLQPTKFEDLIAMVALYRPGPMEWIPDFIDGKHGRREVKYLHPVLEPILAETYGVAVTQEQVMQISRDFAGFSFGEADILRKVMSKKLKDKVAAQKQKFIAGAMKQGHSRKLAEEVFAFIEPFAGYGFNKPHSACYAFVAYQTAYLKCHYPHEFMAALMTSEKDFTDKVVRSINECRRLGIEILPPDVNESETDFNVVGDRIRFGLAAVKNVGVGATCAILEARRQGGPFKSIFDFCRRVDLKQVNSRVIESLIKCGAFDSINTNRAQLLAALETAIAHAQKELRDRQRGQLGLFGALAGAGGVLPDPPLPRVKRWTSRERLAAEKETLGFYVTGHPMFAVRDELAHYVTTDSIRIHSESDRARVTLAGVVTKVRRLSTGKKEPMAIVTLEDLEGLIDAVFYPRVYAERKHHLETNAILIVSGEVRVSDTSRDLIVDEVKTLQEAREELCRRLTIRLPADQSDQRLLKSLQELLRAHPGSVPVSVCVKFPRSSPIYEARLVCDTVRIAPSVALTEGLEELLGERGYSFC
jgi:DNA polymerase-3 subunit alpha